jgi:hypothetical protein
MLSVIMLSAVMLSIVALFGSVVPDEIVCGRKLKKTAYVFEGLI